MYRYLTNEVVIFLTLYEARVRLLLYMLWIWYQFTLLRGRGQKNWPWGRAGLEDLISLTKWLFYDINVQNTTTWKLWLIAPSPPTLSSSSLSSCHHHHRHHHYLYCHFIITCSYLTKGAVLLGAGGHPQIHLLPPPPDSKVRWKNFQAI